MLNELYLKKVTESNEQLQKTDQSDDNYEPLRKRTNKLADLSSLLKKTNWKNRVEFPAICIQLNCSIILVCVIHTFRMFFQTQIKQQTFSHNISGPCGS